MEERLHHHPLSPYGRKAWVAALHRGQPVERVDITLGTGALSRPEFLALSPMGKLPVLETETGPVFESTSIIEYWEERGPRVLLPVGLERVARHFDRLGDLYLLAPVAALWWSAESEEGIEAPGVARRAWGVFEKQLADGRTFVAGHTFTLGDLGAAIATDYLIRLDVEPPESVARWCARCFAIDAMARSLDEAMPYIARLHPRARAATAALGKPAAGPTSG